MLLLVVLGTLIAGGVGIFLLEVVVDGVLQDPFARFFLWAATTLFGQKTKVRVVEPGQIRKLLINMPPRHMKSTLVSVLWPAWVWTFRPDIRWLYTSYALSLSIRDTMKMRAVITSPWYQALFSDSFRLQADQNEKSKFFNNAAQL